MLAEAPLPYLVTRRVRETRAHGFDDLPSRWHHTDDDQRATIHRRLAVDEDLVLAVVPANQVDFRPELAPDPRRHTDGVQS